jgi:hypothetical protein
LQKQGEKERILKPVIAQSQAQMELFKVHLESFLNPSNELIQHRIYLIFTNEWVQRALKVSFEQVKN